MPSHGPSIRRKNYPEKAFFFPGTIARFSLCILKFVLAAPIGGDFKETIQAGPGPPFYFFREWGYHYVETASLRDAVRAALLPVLWVQQL